MPSEKDVAAHQALPVRTDGPCIQDLVITELRGPLYSRSRVHALVAGDLEARKQVGLERYGTVLQAHNGRDALLDAYQEALDLTVYLRQVVEEAAAEMERVIAKCFYVLALELCVNLRDEMRRRGRS